MANSIIEDQLSTRNSLRNNNSYANEIKDFVSNNIENVKNHINNKLSNAMTTKMANGFTHKNFDSFLKTHLDKSESQWLGSFSNKNQLNRILNQSFSNSEKQLLATQERINKSITRLRQTLDQNKFKFTVLLPKTRAEKGFLSNDLTKQVRLLSANQKSLNVLYENYDKFKSLLGAAEEKMIFQKIFTHHEDLDKNIERVEYILKNNLTPGAKWINQENVQNYVAMQNKLFPIGIDLRNHNQDQYFQVLNISKGEKSIFKIPSIAENEGNFFNPQIESLDGAAYPISILNEPNFKMLKATLNIEQIYKQIENVLQNNQEPVYLASVENGKVVDVAIFDFEKTLDNSFSKQGPSLLVEYNGIKPLSPKEVGNVFLVGSELNSRELSFITKESYNQHLSGHEINLPNIPEVSKTMFQGLER